MKCDAENYLNARRGEDMAQAKLTDDDVRMIRQIHREGLEQIAKIRAACAVKALAGKFEVCPGTVEKLLAYKTWRHVK